MGTVEIMDIELLGNIRDKIINVAFDAVLDGIQQRRVGLVGIQGQTSKHGGIKLDGFPISQVHTSNVRGAATYRKEVAMLEISAFRAREDT